MLVEAAETRLAALEGPGLAQAEEAVRLAQVGYNARRFSLLELLDVQGALTTARRSSLKPGSTGPARLPRSIAPMRARRTNHDD